MTEHIVANTVSQLTKDLEQLDEGSDRWKITKASIVALGFFAEWNIPKGLQVSAANGLSRFTLTNIRDWLEDEKLTPEVFL